MQFASNITRIKRSKLTLTGSIGFVLFHNKRHPTEMGKPEIEAFLTHLAVQRRVVASTRNQALCALIFLYRYVLQQEIDLSTDAVLAKQSRY